MCKEFKYVFTTLMTDNLSLLRKAINLTQEELAEIIGLSRYTLMAIENKQRKMTWNTFLSLLLVFQANDKSRKLMEMLGIYTEELKEYIAADDKQFKKY